MNRVDANLGRARDSNSWMRAMVVLSDHGIRTVPDELTGVTRPDMTVSETFDPLRAPILQWLEQEKVRYYFYRPESEIFWHFDVRGLPFKGFPPKGAADAMDWRLYEVDEGGFHQIIPPRTHDWPRTMPGM